MADPIQIVLVAKGVAELQQTFRSVEQTILGFERSIGTASERGSRARLTVAQREASERQKIVTKGANEEARAAKVGVTAVEKAERDKLVAAERTARAMAGIHSRSAAMAAQAATRQADAEIREAARVHAARVAFARNMGGMITGSIGGATRGIVGAGRGLLSSALQVGGGFGVADSVSREIKLTGQAGTIAAGAQADADGKKWKTSEILKGARGTANAMSLDPEEVLKGIGKYKDLTGNLGDAMKLAPQMAKIATATGASTEDLMANAGHAFNAGLKGDDIVRMARVQTMQGMQGALEVKDMKQYGARLSAGATLFGGDRATNIATMGALSQVAMQHGPATTAAEATMGSLRFATDIAKHSASLKAHGIDVGDGKGGLRDARGIMRDMLVATGGDVTKLGAMGLGDRGIKPLQGFSAIYRDAMGGTRQKGESDAEFGKRQEKGKNAVLAEFDKFTKGVSDAEIDMSAKERLADADKQVEKAMNELRDAVGIQLLPEFMKLVDALRDNIPHIQHALAAVAEFAKWFAANPIKGVGAVVLGAVAKDLAMAGIGAAVKQALVALIAGNAPVPGGAAAPSIANKALAVAGGGSAAAGGAVALGALGQAALLTKFGAETGGAILAGKEQGENIAAMLASADPKKRAEGEKQLDAAKKKAGGVEKTSAGAERVGTLGAMLINPIGAGVNVGVDAAMNAAGKKSNTDRSLETLQANEIVNTVELRKQIATAVVGGVTDGMASKAGTAASANAPSTTLPLSARP